jgi:hypothetical protein
MTTPPAFVLYIHSKCEHCQTIQRRLQDHPLPTVYIQNVVLIQDRPQWLNGVPIIADTHMGLLYKGSDCLVFLTKLWELPHKQIVVQSTATVPVVDTMDALFMVPADSAHVPEDEGITVPKFSEDSLSKLMDMRAQQIPTASNQQIT